MCCIKFGVSKLIFHIRCLTTLVISVVLLSVGVKNPLLTDKSIGGLWRLGFGAISAQSFTSWKFPGVLSIVLVANAPQLLLSFLYLTYNGLFTCMLLAQEWSKYGHQRGPLRVTFPMGAQRSTYWLQIPYRYGIPLLVLSGVLHWLVSQSIFFVRVIAIGRDENDDMLNTISTCGYSCIAIITVIIVGSLALIIGNLCGFRRYREGTLMVGSCSAAISAACHRPEGDANAALLPVNWGAVETSDGEVGHCCLTSLEVTRPVKCQVYKGLATAFTEQGTAGSTRGAEEGALHREMER